MLVIGVPAVWLACISQTDNPIRRLYLLTRHSDLKAAKILRSEGH